VNLERLFRTRVDWIPLMGMRALRHGISWHEIPADEWARIGGEQELQIFRWGAVYFLQLLREWVGPSTVGSGLLIRPGAVESGGGWR